MTVIPGVPRAPKGNYRPANITPDHTVDHQAFTHDPSLTTDPYLHPSYAHAFRRPASPIAEGKFNPSLHTTPIRRKSVSRQNTATSGISRTKSIPLPPPAPAIRRSPGPIAHKRHGSSGSISTHPSSKGSPPASRPPSILTSPDQSPPASPSHAAGVKVVLPHQASATDEELDPVAAILSGSTRAGKLTKRRRSERTVTSQNSTAPSSPVVAPDPPKVKSRSRFGFLRFGKAAAGRTPSGPFPDAMLPPERQPSTRDIGEPSGRFLSPASSFVVLDGPPSPPPESIGVPLPDAVREERERDRDPRSMQYRDSPIYGLEGNRYMQGDLATRMAQANLNVDRVDGLDTTGPYGLAYHQSGPYDAIGSVVGSQRDSRVVGSPADMRNRHSLLPPSIAGSSVHAGHRTYPGIGAAVQPPPGAALSSPYPPDVNFIPEALPPGQMQVYSNVSHSRAGSGGSGGSQNSYGPATGPPVLPHAHVESADLYSRELVHPGEQYGGYAPQHGSAFTDGRPPSDDFYTGQQARFAAPPEDHSDGQREEGHWDGENGSDYGNPQYHRRSRDEEMKFVPLRQPIVSPANDVQSHYGHESQVYSEHRSHRSGGGSIMSGSSAGRGSLPSRHHPRSLVMPSPLQGQNGSPPLAPEGSPEGYSQRHSRSPAQFSNGRRSRDHSQGRSSMAPSWQSPSLYGQPQAAVIPMSSGKGGRLHKKY